MRIYSLCGVCQDFRLNYLGKYHDWHVQNNTLLLSNVFENFQKIYLEIYELDPPRLFTALGLA